MGADACPRGPGAIRSPPGTPQTTCRRVPRVPPGNPVGTTVQHAGSVRAMRRTDHLFYRLRQPDKGSQSTAVVITGEEAAQRRLLHGPGDGHSRNPDRVGRGVAPGNPGDCRVLPVNVIHPEHDAPPAGMSRAAPVWTPADPLPENAPAGQAGAVTAPGRARPACGSLIRPRAVSSAKRHEPSAATEKRMVLRSQRARVWTDGDPRGRRDRPRLNLADRGPG